MKKTYKLLSLLLALAMVLSLGAISFASEEASSEEPAEDPIVVGVSWSEDVNEDGSYSEDVQMFLDVIEMAGGVGVYLPQITTTDEAEAALETVDAVIFTGGEDIAPALYGETEDPELEEVNAVRDTSDYLLLKQVIADDVPALCICRGSQMLNVVCGGTLIQDIPTYLGIDAEESQHRDPTGEDFAVHTVYFEENSILEDITGTTEADMYSWHHQAVGELGDDLVVTAYADDGIVEGTYMPDKNFIVGVQFHPEYMVADGMTEYLCYFEALIEAARTADEVVVGISWKADINEDGSYPSGVENFMNILDECGAKGVYLPQVTNTDEAKEVVESVDAIIFTGGEDIAPVLYDETEDPELEGVNAVRDVSDYLLLKQAIVDDVPALCICRGSQMLNVVCGGTLIQDIPTYLGIDAEESQHRDPEGENYVMHTIYFDEDSILAEIAGTTEADMYGWHHQAVGEVGEGLEVIAHSSDGIVEGTYMPEKTFIVGIQFHPEAMIKDGMTEYLCYFQALVDAAE